VNQETVSTVFTGTIGFWQFWICEYYCTGPRLDLLEALCKKVDSRNKLILVSSIENYSDHPIMLIVAWITCIKCNTQITKIYNVVVFYSTEHHILVERCL